MLGRTYWRKDGNGIHCAIRLLQGGKIEYKRQRGLAPFDHRSGRNACAIQRIDNSHVRYWYFKREKGFLYNSYLLTNVIEAITR